MYSTNNILGNGPFNTEELNIHLLRCSYSSYVTQSLKWEEKFVHQKVCTFRWVTQLYFSVPTLG